MKARTKTCLLTFFQLNELQDFYDETMKHKNTTSFDMNKNEANMNNLKHHSLISKEFPYI